VIGGNPNYSGLVIAGGSTGNIVASNAIVDNGQAGVFILNSPQNVIGVAGGPNQVQGNGFSGIDLEGTATTGNVVQYNQVLLNSPDGVYLFQAPGNLIGGPNGAGNTITGSGFSGVHLDGVGTLRNVVQGNTITGSAAYGVLISDATQNVIGGPGDASNTIQGNAFGGIQVTVGGLPASTPSGGNVILSNNAQAQAITTGRTTKRHVTSHAGTSGKTTLKVHTKALPAGPVGLFGKLGRVSSKSVSKTR
jgi:hypothetical protein